MPAHRSPTVYLATPCPNDVAGFPCDEELQRLRRSWWESTDEAERAKLADRIQERAYQVVPYINGGQWKHVHGGADECLGAGGDDGAGVLGGGEGGVITEVTTKASSGGQILH